MREIVDPHHRHTQGRDPRAQDARDWARLIVASLARGILATALGLAFWAAAPALIGWHPTTVMTGSMEPRIHPGDVVVSVPTARAKVSLGKVILFDDPSHPGELRLHRYYEKGPHGTLVTKGDANPQPDSTPVSPAAVRGVAMLRVPWIGLPIVWIHEGRWLFVAVAAVILTLLLGFTGIDSGLRHDRDDPARARRLQTDRGRASVMRAEAARTAYVRAERSAMLRRDVRRRARRVRRLRQAGAAATVLLIAGAVFSAAPPPRADAVAFGATTANPASTFGMTTPVSATNPTCANNADGTTVTISWGYTGTTPDDFALTYNGTVFATATGAARSATLSTTSLLGLGLLTYPVAVRTDLTASNSAWSTTSATTIGVKVNALLGATSVRCA